MTNSLRTFVGGKLNNSDSFLPYGYPHTTYIFEKFGLPQLWKFRGDSRSNKTPMMTALVALWGAEHNRLCDEFAAANSSWNDETYLYSPPLSSFPFSVYFFSFSFSLSFVSFLSVCLCSISSPPIQIIPGSQKMVTRPPFFSSLFIHFTRHI